MKETTEKKICIYPLAVWIIIIPLIVKIKIYPNSLQGFVWSSVREQFADFFLYYKSMYVTIVGTIMLILLCWQINKLRIKNQLFSSNHLIFVPIFIYLILAVLSSILSEYRYFSVHGLPDQFETIWNLISYIVALCYCYFLIIYQDAEQSVFRFIYIGAGFIGIICVLQFFKIDIYRIIYANEGYSFTFERGTVYGPFYNTNYVGFYSLLFIPLFVLMLIHSKNWIIRLSSAILAVFLLIAMIGAKSITSEIAMISVVLFATLFVILKYIKRKKILWIPLLFILSLSLVGTIVIAPHVKSYLQACNTEKQDLENIYTRDDSVEIDYKNQKLFVQIVFEEDAISFNLKDQNEQSVDNVRIDDESGYYYYQITDSRFEGINITPAIISEDPIRYGFRVTIDDKDWYFTNQMTDDDTYYYYTDQLRLTKLTDETPSGDFEPLVKMTNLASGRGYIWNKTIALLKNHIFLGSGADTFAIVYPNGDFVDLYNNGYDNTIVSKPHSLYLQIATQTGVLSLICFLIFYLWYFISSVKIYFKNPLDNSLAISGFAIMLGTLGYMISGLANDSTITVAPLYWAMTGIGIGINQKLRLKQN